MLISLAIVIALPKPHGIRALIASTILRLIFSVGLQPTLFLLGAFNVSMNTFIAAFLLTCKQECLPFWLLGSLPGLSVQKKNVWVSCLNNRSKSCVGGRLPLNLLTVQ